MELKHRCRVMSKKATQINFPVFLLLALFLISSAYSCQVPSFFPIGVLNYACITLSNTQNVSTPNNFIQRINFDAGAYQRYLVKNLSNIVFFAQNGMQYNAWLEGNFLNEKQAASLSTSNTLLYWVDTNSTIAANSNMTIYIGFGSKLINYLLPGNSTGAAPQLYCNSGCPTNKYGGTDNGAKVFPFYDNFAGTNLSSKWTASFGGDIDPPYISLPYRVQVNNGLRTAIGCLAKGCEGMVAGSAIRSDNLIEDSLVTSYSIQNNNARVGTGLSNTLTVGDSDSHGFELGYDNLFNTYCSICTTLQTIGLNNFLYIYIDGVPESNAYTIQSLWSSKEGIFVYENYTKLLSNSSASILSALLYPAIDVSGNNNLASINLKWFRVRTPPPNGVMPVVTFASVKSILPSIISKISVSTEDEISTTIVPSKSANIYKNIACFL